MSTAREQALHFLDEFRSNMRKAGQATQGVEKFVDDMSALVTTAVGPRTALGILSHALANMEAKQSEAAA